MTEKNITAEELKAHIYKEKVLTEIPGDLLYGLITILEQVVESESSESSFLYSYPDNVKKSFDSLDEKFLEKVEIDWKEYPTAKSFFEQVPVKTMSILGAMAEDLLLLLRQIHLDNINKGLTKKVGTFTNTKDVELP